MLGGGLSTQAYSFPMPRTDAEVNRTNRESDTRSDSKSSAVAAKDGLPIGRANQDPETRSCQASEYGA